MIVVAEISAYLCQFMRSAGIMFVIECWTCFWDITAIGVFVIMKNVTVYGFIKRLFKLLMRWLLNTFGG